jgi:hypothetical protein
VQQRHFCVETGINIGCLPGGPEHTLNIKPGYKLIKQGMCHFNEEKRKAIGKELTKLLTIGFVKEVHHPVWIANLVLVPK